jgi:hypothetical protein
VQKISPPPGFDLLTVKDDSDGANYKYKKPEEAIAGSGGKVFYLGMVLRKLNNYVVP